MEDWVRSTEVAVARLGGVGGSWRLSTDVSDLDFFWRASASSVCSCSKPALEELKHEKAEVTAGKGFVRRREIAQDFRTAAGRNP